MSDDWIPNTSEPPRTSRYWTSRELRRIHDHPTMFTGEKAAAISALLGDSFGRESWAELKKRLRQTR